LEREEKKGAKASRWRERGGRGYRLLLRKKSRGQASLQTTTALEKYAVGYNKTSAMRGKGERGYEEGGRERDGWLTEQRGGGGVKKKRKSYAVSLPPLYY
jgi:hypothetical protein